MRLQCLRLGVSSRLGAFVSSSRVGMLKYLILLNPKSVTWPPFPVLINGNDVQRRPVNSRHTVALRRQSSQRSIFSSTNLFSRNQSVGHSGREKPDAAHADRNVIAPRRRSVHAHDTCLTKAQAIAPFRPSGKGVQKTTSSSFAHLQGLWCTKSCSTYGYTGR